RKEGLKLTRQEHQRPFLEKTWPKLHRSMEITFPLLSGEAGTAMTSPSLCTSGHKRVYITAFGCEICFGPMLGIEQFSVLRFEAATAFLNFITGSRHVLDRLRIPLR